MSIEKITSKIISDAENAANAALDEAKAKADEIVAQAEAKAADILADAEKRGREDKEKLVARKKAVADIDGRKMILETKQQLIGQCFEKAVDKLASLDRKQYIEFLSALVIKTGETEGELILNPRDREAVGAELVAGLSEKISGSRITLAEETRNIRGGFLLKKGSVYMNGTIEALVEEARETLVGEVAGKLFQ